MDEYKIRNLEMIQEIINRMANNSFLLKGWSVTIAVGLISLNIERLSKRIYLLIFLAIIIFWLLDAYFLQLERQYRSLYDSCRRDEIERFDLHLKKKLRNNGTLYYQCLFSKTELGFYMLVIILVLFLIK